MREKARQRKKERKGQGERRNRECDPESETVSDSNVNPCRVSANLDVNICANEKVQKVRR